jgi:hypothetical protein
MRNCGSWLRSISFRNEWFSQRVERQMRVHLGHWPRVVHPAKNVSPLPMIISPATLPTVLEAVFQYWRARPAYARTWPEAEAVASETTPAQLQSLGLPSDFEHFYCDPAGSVRALSGYAVEEDFHFLTVAELRPCEEELLVVSGTGAARERARITVFVDYRKTSWQYGVIADPTGAGYRIVVLAYPGEFKVITRLLATFLCLYLEDALALYGYQNPYRLNHR